MHVEPRLPPSSRPSDREMDGVDPPGPGHFAKRTSRFEEINPRSGPLSPPLPYPLPSLLGDGHSRRHGRSGRRHCGVPPCGGVAGRGVEAALPPSLPLQEEARHGGGQARPARLREGRGCRARQRAAPSLPSPTSRTGHGGDQAWPARLREVRGWAGLPAGRGHDHDGQRWQAQIPPRGVACASPTSALRPA